jgi:hypothetical protein
VSFKHHVSPLFSQKFSPYKNLPRKIVSTIVSSITAMSAPHKAARLVCLFLAFAFAVVGGSVGLNALIKSNQEQTRLRHALPPGATLNVNLNGIYQTGVVLTTVCALIALLTLIYFILSLARPAKCWLAFQAWTLGFCAVWLFPVMIAYDNFVRTRSAGLSVTVGGVLWPFSTIQGVENRLGVTNVYRHVYYRAWPFLFPYFPVA